MGHASLLIGDLSPSSTYVSWWPKTSSHGLSFYLRKSPSDKERVFNQEVDDYVFVTASYVEDCLSMRNSPHVIYGLRGLDIREMESSWDNIIKKEKSSFSALNKNCAAIVSRILKAGLKDSFLKSRAFGLFGGDHYVWTPKRVAVVCNQLRDNNAAWKIKLDGRISKKTLIKSVLRLR